MKFLVGNKSDLMDEKVISLQQGTSYAQEIGASFMEVSAKENENISELFTEMGRKLKELTMQKAPARPLA